MNKLLVVVLTVLLLMNPLMGGGLSINDRFSQNSHEFLGVMPDSNTAIVSTTFYVSAITLFNNSASAKVVNIRDRSTSCASGPCRLVPKDLSLPATSVTIIELPWRTAGSGIQLSAADGVSVEYSITGTY